MRSVATCSGRRGSDGRLNYDEVGATRSGILPDGYHHVRRRELIGSGRTAFDAAAETLMTWKMHRRSLPRVRPSRGRVEVGSTVSLVAGFRCEVVYLIQEPGRIGFAYGTLGGHPECGEESFLVEFDAGDVYFVITAFSRPGTWYARLAGPVGRWAQQRITDRYVAALRS